ncbi:hypothetical protein ACTFIY_003712 [Dictyostelium cf. discoideum]
MIKKDNIKLKLTIIGDWNVGKSSLLYRFVNDVFYEQTKLSMGDHFIYKTVLVHGESIDLQITDTSGMEKFRSLNNSFYIVDSNIVKSYADNLNFKFFETSSKNSINVEETFITLVEEILIKKNYQFNNITKKKGCSIN